MARDLNKIQIIGHLGADPEMRFTTQGTAVTTFRVAANYGDDTEWFRIVAWERLAEVCNEYLRHGARVYVEGRLRTRKWRDREGQERYTTEVVANDMIILSAPTARSTPTPESRLPTDTPRIIKDADLPFKITLCQLISTEAAGVMHQAASLYP